jgi:3-deoxy-D-manno-octulosonic-acid transferase
MHLLYSILLGIAAIALLPYFAWQAVVKRKYLKNLRERLGRLPQAFQADQRPAIWLHAVSVGEARTAAPLLAALRAALPDYRLIVSTTTATGQEVVRSRRDLCDGVCYFPFDWRLAVRRSLDRINPRLVILMESELWPNFLDECRRRNIPTLVANGRISDRSFARSQRFKPFARWLFGHPSRLAMQSETDAKRARSLGAPPERVAVCGNIKYDVRYPSNDGIGKDSVQELLERLSFGSAPLIVAGSTCEGEEEILIAALKAVREDSNLANVRILIAPRHPERFESVARFLSESGLRLLRRSAFKCDRDADPRFDVLLLDSIGELARLYVYSDVVFVGGSLVPKGGHNVLEPASVGRPIVVGPHMENFRDIANDLVKRDAMVQLRIAPPDVLIRSLVEAFKLLLTDGQSAHRLGENARAAVEANRGATDRHLKLVLELLEKA